VVKLERSIPLSQTDNFRLPDWPTVGHTYGQAVPALMPHRWPPTLAQYIFQYAPAAHCHSLDELSPTERLFPLGQVPKAEALHKFERYRCGSLHL
jgi:hypothetical protein